MFWVRSRFIKAIFINLTFHNLTQGGEGKCKDNLGGVPKGRMIVLVKSREYGKTLISFSLGSIGIKRKYIYSMAFKSKTVKLVIILSLIRN